MPGIIQVVCTSINCRQKVLFRNNVFSYGKQYDPDSTRAGGFGLCIGGKFNTISGNRMNHNESHGIYPSGCEGSTFQGNVCCYNTKTGIKVAWSSTIYTSIIGNVCHDNTLNGIHFHGQQNRDLIGPSKNIIFGNNCYNNDSFGIHVNDLSHSNNLVGNICYHNGNDRDDQIRIAPDCLGNDKSFNIDEY